MAFHLPQEAGEQRPPRSTYRQRRITNPQQARWSRHVAREGDTAGWDIEYLSEAGELNAVEVKASTASTFLNFQLTAGELSAAKDLGKNYWIYLVRDCLTTRPRLQVVNDPAALLAQGLLRAEPLSWNISLQHSPGKVPARLPLSQ
jgi:hypothetical protein